MRWRSGSSVIAAGASGPVTHLCLPVCASSGCQVSQFRCPKKKKKLVLKWVCLVYSFACSSKCTTSLHTVQVYKVRSSEWHNTQLPLSAKSYKASHQTSSPQRILPSLFPSPSLTGPFLSIFFLSFFFNTHKSRLPTWKGVNDTRCKGKFYLTFHLSLTRAIIWSTYDSINSHTKHLSASKVSQNHLQLQLQNEWQTIEQHLSNYLMSNKPKAPAIFLFPPRWTHSHKIRDSIQFL